MRRRRRAILSGRSVGRCCEDSDAKQDSPAAGANAAQRHAGVAERSSACGCGITKTERLQCVPPAQATRRRVLERNAAWPLRYIGWRLRSGAHPIGPARRADGAGDRRSRTVPRAWPFRRLDRPHRQGRVASRRNASQPAGVGRNVVLTLWDWSQPTAYMHDLTSTDKRNPVLNAQGIIYGSPELSSRITSPGSARQ